MDNNPYHQIANIPGMDMQETLVLNNKSTMLPKGTGLDRGYSTRQVLNSQHPSA